MTMIVSCTSPDYVFQVSDRRVSSRDGTGPFRTENDETNKAVMWGLKVAFASAGRSHIGERSVTEWLAETIAGAPTGKPQADVFRYIATCAARNFGSLPEPAERRRHAFVGVGWTAPQPWADLVPFHVAISNAIEPDGSFALTPADTFAIRRNVDSDGMTRVRVVGILLSPSEVDAIVEVVRAALPDDPASALIALEDTVLRVHASQPGGPVGSRLMSVCIPRVAADEVRRGGPEFAMLADPVRGACTYRYVSPNAEPEQYGPAFAQPGAPVVMDWRGGDLPGGGQFSEARFVSPPRR